MIRAIIQARMGGQRFPGKVLYDLCGKPVLKHVIDRVRQAKSVDEIVVATAGPGAETIGGHCQEWNIRCLAAFVPEEDVLKRFVFASEDMSNEDWIVRVCADNPLIMPSAIDVGAPLTGGGSSVSFTAIEDAGTGTDPGSKSRGVLWVEGRSGGSNILRFEKLVCKP